MLARAQELSGQRKNHAAIQRLLVAEFGLRPARARALMHQINPVFDRRVG